MAWPKYNTIYWLVPYMDALNCSHFTPPLVLARFATYNASERRAGADVPASPNQASLPSRHLTRPMSPGSRRITKCIVSRSNQPIECYTWWGLFVRSTHTRDAMHVPPRLSKGHSLLSEPKLSEWIIETPHHTNRKNERDRTSRHSVGCIPQDVWIDTSPPPYYLRFPIGDGSMRPIVSCHIHHVHIGTRSTIDAKHFTCFLR